MKEQRLITENQVLAGYLADAHALRRKELARLSKRLLRLPGFLLKRAAASNQFVHPNPE